MADPPKTPPARVFYFGGDNTRALGFDTRDDSTPAESAGSNRRRRVIVRPSDAEIHTQVLRRGIEAVAARSHSEAVVKPESIFRALATKGITPANNLPFTELFADRICEELTGSGELQITAKQVRELGHALRDEDLPDIPLAAMLALADQLEAESQATAFDLSHWLGFEPEVATSKDLRALLQEMARDLRVLAVMTFSADVELRAGLDTD